MNKIKYYLWKLKYLEGTKIQKKDLDKKKLPDNVYFNQWSGIYTKVDCDDLNIKDIDIFIKVKNAYNFNIIRICVVIFTICICLITLAYS